MNTKKLLHKWQNVININTRLRRCSYFFLHRETVIKIFITFIELLEGLDRILNNYFFHCNLIIYKEEMLPNEWWWDIIHNNYFCHYNLFSKVLRTDKEKIEWISIWYFFCLAFYENAKHLYFTAALKHFQSICKLW